MMILLCPKKSRTNRLFREKNLSRHIMSFEKKLNQYYRSKLNCKKRRGEKSNPQIYHSSYAEYNLALKIIVGHQILFSII